MAAYFEVWKLNPLEEAEIDVRSHNMASRSDTLRQPASNRPMPSANLQAAPAGTDTNIFHTAGCFRIASELEKPESLLLSLLW
jgi:hypothetical protein